MIHQNKGRSGGPKRAVFIGTIVILALLVLGGLVMLLWNAILPPVAHVGKLDYPQAIGLLLLCRLSFGSFRPGGGGRWKREGQGWRQKWSGMNEQERSAFRDEWKKRCDVSRGTHGEEAD